MWTFPHICTLRLIFCHVNCCCALKKKIQKLPLRPVCVCANSCWLSQSVVLQFQLLFLQSVEPGPGVERDSNKSESWALGLVWLCPFFFRGSVPSSKIIHALPPPPLLPPCTNIVPLPQCSAPRGNKPVPLGAASFCHYLIFHPSILKHNSTHLDGDLVYFRCVQCLHRTDTRQSPRHRVHCLFEFP